MTTMFAKFSPPNMLKSWDKAIINVFYFLSFKSYKDFVIS